MVKEKSFPEAQEAFAVFSEGGVSGIELRAFLDRELPDWIATIDPVNAPAIKNAETLSARDLSRAPAAVGGSGENRRRAIR